MRLLLVCPTMVVVVVMVAAAVQTLGQPLCGVKTERWGAREKQMAAQELMQEEEKEEEGIRAMK